MEHYLYFILLYIGYITKCVFGQTNPPPEYTIPADVATYLQIATNNISEEKDLGPCTCDLIQGLCDYHCCCDPDCDQGLINTWVNDPRFLCKTSNNSRMENHLCMNETKTYNYNTYRSGLFNRDQISNLLCVTWDNSRDMGNFYLTPPTTNLEPNFNKNYTDWKNTYIPPVNTPSTGNTYTFGENIRLTGTSQNLFWYQSDPYGNCVQTLALKFQIPNKKTVCNNKKSIPVIDWINIGISANGLKEYYVNQGTSLISSEERFVGGYTLESVNVKLSSQNNQITAIKTVIICRNSATAGNGKMIFELKWSSNDVLQKSGNPGYHYKKPVLFLIQDTTLYENGYYIQLRNKQGDCTLNANNYNPYDEAIRFGVDSIYSCNIIEANIESTYFDTLLNEKLKTIGRFGSSDSTIKPEWNITIDNNVPIRLQSGQDTTIILEILISKFGSKSKPQHYILGSKITSFNEASPKPTLRFITKFIPVSSDQFIQSNLETSLPPFQKNITGTEI